MSLQSENINELASALCKAQSKLMPAIKDKKNPFYKSNYSDLDSVWEACRIPLTDNGLSVVQQMQYVEDKTLLVTTLIHSSGQWMRSFAPIISSKNDAQGLGAGITYMRRYSLCAMIGITQEDDDGESDRKHAEQAARESRKVTPIGPPSAEPIISKEQYMLLKKLMIQVDDKLNSSINKFIKDDVKISDLSELPAKHFNNIKNALVKFIEAKNEKVTA